ncbi:MAG: glycosyltransferase [Planctomycetota bacterium]
MSTARPRLLACGAWDQGASYPRTRAMLAALRAQGVAVAECRVELPLGGQSKQRVAATPLAWPGLAVAMAGRRRAFLRAVRRAVAEHRPDAVLVPYPGHLVAPWVRRAFAGPVVLDLFLSAYDTAVGDRALLRPGSLPARVLRWLDRRAVAAADLVLLDTPEHARSIAELLDRPPRDFSWVPVSDPEAPATPPVYQPPPSGGPVDLLFFGTGVPLHGLRHLLDAVALVPAVRLTLIGGTAADRAHARTVLPPRRLRLGPELVPRAELAAHLAACHLVAGVFGAGAKAQRVVPFKVVHGLAAGRPVLTAETAAICRWLQPGRDVVTCPAAEPAALRAALERLVARPDTLQALAAAARPAYDAQFSEAAVGRRLLALLEPLTGVGDPRASGAAAVPVPAALGGSA